MGEKEQGAARESSAPSISEREAGSGLASGRREVSGIGSESERTHEDDWEAQTRGMAGSGGHSSSDAAQAAIIKSKSNITNNRETAPGGEDDGGGGTLDESAASVVKTKTKSNQSNDRLGHEDDWEAPASARTTEVGGAGDDIAIGDPGVNGN